MRKRALVCGVVLALALTPATSSATDTSGGCGTHGTGVWEGAAMCNFFLQGLPLTFWAGTYVETGAARVHIRVTAYDAPTITLFECSDSGDKDAYCEVSIPDGVTYVQWRSFETLSCYVEGRGVGTFWCQSAYGL